MQKGKQRRGEKHKGQVKSKGMGNTRWWDIGKIQKNILYVWGGKEGLGGIMKTWKKKEIPEKNGGNT